VIGKYEIIIGKERDGRKAQVRFRGGASEGDASEPRVRLLL
jgi:hypothetical protein